MRIAETLLPEFDHEAATTRTCLERVTQETWDWKPHQKSFSMGHLVGHIANLPTWAPATLSHDTFDTAPGGEQFKTPLCETIKDALGAFDKNIADARAALEAASDENMMGNWSLLNNGATILTMPRVAVIRSFVMNHMIHHRGQLTVYLRENDLSVPSVYGPSADEGSMS